MTDSQRTSPAARYWAVFLIGGIGAYLAAAGARAAFTRQDSAAAFAGAAAAVCGLACLIGFVFLLRRVYIGRRHGHHRSHPAEKPRKDDTQNS